MLAWGHALAGAAAGGDAPALSGAENHAPGGKLMMIT